MKYYFCGMKRRKNSDIGIEELYPEIGFRYVTPYWKVQKAYKKYNKIKSYFWGVKQPDRIKSYHSYGDEIYLKLRDTDDIVLKHVSRRGVRNLCGMYMKRMFAVMVMGLEVELEEGLVLQVADVSIDKMLNIYEFMHKHYRNKEEIKL